MCRDLLNQTTTLGAVWALLECSNACCCRCCWAWVDSSTHVQRLRRATPDPAERGAQAPSDAAHAPVKATVFAAALRMMDDTMPGTYHDPSPPIITRCAGTQTSAGGMMVVTSTSYARKSGRQQPQGAAQQSSKEQQQQQRYIQGGSPCLRHETLELPWHCQVPWQ